MRPIRIIAAFAVMLVCFIIPISASESSAELYTADEFNVESILDSLPENVRRSLPEGDIFTTDGFSRGFTAEYFFSLIGNTVSVALSPVIKTLSQTLGLVLIAAALSALKGVLRSDSLSVLFEFLSGLLIMLTLYGTLSTLVETVRIYLTELTMLINAMVPVMIAIGCAGGNISASTVSANAMMLGITFVESLAASGLFPVLKLCFGLGIASGIGSGLRLGGISKLVRGVFTWILGLISAVISAVMTFQSSIAARADSLSMRAMKFAAAKAIPVAGDIASGAVTAVAGSLSLVKGTVGWVGVIIIAVMTLPVILTILLTRLGVVVSCTAADILGLERERGMLDEISGLLGFLAAVCVIAALMFVYALTLFAGSAAALG